MSDLFFRVGGETTEFDRAMDKAVKTGTAAAGEISGRMTKKLFDMKDVGQSIATALGLNIQNIAENVARFVTGVSKEEEAAYKNSEALGNQATDLAIKNMRARLTEEQRYKLAVIERDRLEQKIADTQVKTGADLERLNRARLELEQKNAEIIAYEAQQRASADKEFQEQMKRRSAANLEEYKAMLDKLSAAERQKTLAADIAAEEQTIAALKRSGQSASLLEAELEAKKKLLIEATSAAEKERLDLRRKIAGSGAEELEYLNLSKKVQEGIATGPEVQRLAMIKLQREERALMIEIEKLESKSIDSELSAAEKRRLAELEKQHGKLLDQLKAKGELIASAKEHAAKEVEVTKALEQQAQAAIEQSKAMAKGAQSADEHRGAATETRTILAQQASEMRNQIEQNEKIIRATVIRGGTENGVTLELRQQNAELDRQAQKIEQILESMHGLGSPLGLHNLGNLSTDILNAKARQLEEEMRKIEREYQQKGYTSNARGDNYYLVSQIDSIKQELKFRDQFTSAYARGGREGALSQYVAQGRDPLSFDTALANMQSWSKGQDLTNQKLDATNRTLGSISRQLASAGFSTV